MRFEHLDTEQSGSTTVTPRSSGSIPWNPKAYHRRAVKWGIERGAAGFFLDPGLGKTSITLAISSLLLEQKLIKGVLVVAPLRPVYMTWPDEMAKWADFNHLTYEVLHGKDKTKAIRRKANLYLINPEGLRWLFLTLGSKVENWPFDVLVLDESSKFKNTRTQRFKELRDHLPQFRRRYILTGTPSPNGLIDLFGQIYCLDLGHALGRYITHYHMQYFSPTGYGGYEWALQPGADKKIYQAIAPLVLRMDEKDYLELPPLIEANHFVELPKSARTAYDAMEDDFLVKLESGGITAGTAATATVKLRQIANGGAYLDAVPNVKTRGVAHLHDAKTECLLDLLEELEGQPTLVAYEFDHDLQRLQVALKKRGFGDVPDFRDAKKSKDIADRWNAGELPVLLGHPQSVAHGLNLQQAGRAIIWYALTWDLEQYIQFIKRIHRQGQKGRVFVHHIIARKTVDEAMMSAIKRKDKSQRALLDALRSYYAPRRRAA